MEELRTAVDRLRALVDAAGLAPAHVTALVVIASCACAGLAALWWTARPDAVVVPTPLASVAVASARPTATDGPSTMPSPPLVVHVTGAVVSEGVIELAAGSRVVDAIAAVGGPRRGARTGQLNLARPLQDGEQVHVPSRRESVVGAAGGVAGGTVAGAPPRVGGTGGASTAAAGAVTPVEPGGLVNLNTATAAELEALPGLGPVLAERITAHRAAVGGFTTVEQLLDVTGIGDKTVAALRDLVTV